MSLKTSLILAALCLLIHKVSTANQTYNRLKEFFTWKTLDFDFPDEATRTSAIQSGAHVKGNSLILGVEKWKDKLFVTTPRSWKSGVPSTLNYVNLKNSKPNSSPNLIPYPNYALNNIHSSTGPNTNGTNKIISVFRINVDVCDRLWMIDTGLADIRGEKKVISTPRIIIIDLTTDRIIKEHVIAKEAIVEKSFFANILVDASRNNCDRSFAYIPDLGGFQLIVYDLKKDETYKVNHHYFYFDPESGNYNVGGLNFQ
uniref:Protein yellow n=2 Tax=Cacopsylla melanoneura TaxID=428564 RepID=A0A8D9A1Q5_9HEMI